jgi:putative FmdB family regulatory protein
MPLYEYECEACGQRFEVIRKFSDPPLEVCTLCDKGPVNRLQSSPAIQFKGSGWYITDYAKKGEGDKKGEGGKGEGGKGEGGREGKGEGGKAEGGTARSDAASTDTSTTETKRDSAAKPESPTATTPAKSDGAAKKD